MYSPHDKLQDIIDYFFESDILTKQIMPLLQRESTFTNAYNEHRNNNRQCDLVNSSLCLFGVLITNRGTNHEHKNINYKNEELIIYTIIDIFLKYISIEKIKLCSKKPMLFLFIYLQCSVFGVIYTGI